MGSGKRGVILQSRKNRNEEYVLPHIKDEGLEVLFFCTL